jgi:hypothetical protein
MKSKQAVFVRMDLAGLREGRAYVDVFLWRWKHTKDPVRCARRAVYTAAAQKGLEVSTQVQPCGTKMRVWCK